MKTKKLLIEYEYNFDLLGIICQEKDYKTAWLINNQLGISLKKQEDLQIDWVNNSRISISNFIFDKEYSSFRLIKNKAVAFKNIERPFLVPELKEMDYFVQLESEDGYWNLEEISEKIRGISAVQFLQTIKTDNLKSKENLIFS